MVDAGPSLRLHVISDRAAVMTRQFRAPLETVFEALTEPEHVQHWWGPHGHRATVLEIDLRVGGRWRILTEDREGREHPFTGMFLEVKEPHRTVQTFTYDSGPFAAARSLETLTLERHGDATTMTIIARYSSPELMDVMLETGLEERASESYDRLQDYLDTLAGAPRDGAASTRLG